MLLSCVIVHILQETNLNVAIVSMVKHPMSDAEIKSEYLCYASVNSTSSTSDIANKSEINTTLTDAQNQVPIIGNYCVKKY